MITYPNAKINLGLSVTERRADGYHNIETVFYPLPLCDILEITLPEPSSDPYTWLCTGTPLDVPAEKNICIKALMRLRERYPIPTVGLHLHKVIPSGAGLGGGSADAAFTIKYINELLGLGISNSELKEIISPIGADCAFFIDNAPALAAGIGNVLEPCEVSLKGKYIVLVKPPVHISTAEAYAGIRPAKPEHSVAEVIAQPIEEWRHKLRNDFEASVFPNHPEIAAIKEQLYAHGAAYAAMSGSGSTVFGIFHAPVSLSFDGCFTWSGTLQH